MGIKKKDLDKLFAKVGIDSETAERLHRANGTHDESQASTASSGGHGSAKVEKPSLDF